MAPYQEVEFQTYDGVTLRGDLYLPEKPNAPLVILTHGVSTRELFQLPSPPAGLFHCPQWYLPIPSSP